MCIRDSAKTIGDVLAARGRLDSSWNPDARTDFKDAIASYTSAIEIDPDDANLYAARAATLAAAGRSRAAEQDYLRAIELDPDSAQLHETLGWMYAFPPHQNKTKAVVHLERAVELEPTARSLGMLARVRFMIQDDYEGAWELLEQAVQDDPLELEPRVQRAVWCFNQERYEDALGEIDQVLDIAPRYSYALRWRGKIHGQLERYEEALADFAAAQPMERSHPFWWLVQRSDVYIAMGQHEDAFADLARAVQVRPEGGFSWHKLEQASRQVSDTDAAVETLQPLCDKSDPSIAARAHALMASIFLRLEQFDDAETSLTRAAESRQQQLDAGPNKAHTLPTANNPFRVVLPWITSCPDAQLRSRLRALVGEFAESNSRTEKETQPDR